jgi:hypothetical protein
MIVPKQPYTVNEHGVRSNDIRCTPPALVEICRKLVDVDRFTLDVAASPGNAICEDYYSLERGQDGLKQCWYGHVWCNPPYSDIGSWVRKAWIEHSGLRTDVDHDVDPGEPDGPAVVARLRGARWAR